MSALPGPALFQPNAGWSTCPACQRTWVVTPWADCLLPACGCYGTETGHGNRPCSPCGMEHARRCERMPERTS